MNRKITAAVAFDTPERRARVDEAAKKLGFEVRWVKDRQVAEEDVRDCEIFFGMLPPALLREARSLKWLQCSFAGIDRYADPSLYAGNVTVTNASGAYGITISEHMIVTLLMLMRRMPEQFIAGGKFYKTAKIHDRNTMTHETDYAEIMRNKQIRNSPCLLNFLQKFQYLRRDCYIQSRCRFI